MFEGLEPVMPMPTPMGALAADTGLGTVHTVSPTLRPNGRDELEQTTPLPLATRDFRYHAQPSPVEEATHEEVDLRQGSS
ncbi:unnamed protein product [Protopolystoma xenopodis]|uniref:Uncharacterized protein n=1 Tax=Protopolystoma xenopodis TaxID=117903 RepID=A0A448XEF5_9PLAT|nr:unnamed protein product [Protopolystoma xenopodis]